MKQFNFVAFTPWVGENYENGGLFGKKVLVVGESHYCDSKKTCMESCKTKCPNSTLETVNEFLTECSEGAYSYLRGYQSFERAVMNKELTNEERNAFWQSIIFYEFFQAPQEGAKRALDFTDEEVEEYMPDCIIVWGKRAWERTPDSGGKEGVVTAEDGETMPMWTYTIKGKEIPMTYVYHPSMPNGNSWPYWHKFHKAFLGLDF